MYQSLCSWKGEADVITVLKSRILGGNRRLQAIQNSNGGSRKISNAYI